MVKPDYKREKIYDSFVGTKIEKSQKAQLEKNALKRGVTQGEMIRRAIAKYLIEGISEEFEKEYSERYMRKRDRLMKFDSPKDKHFGVMMIGTVNDSIRNEIRILEGCGILKSGDYDGFIEIVEDEKGACMEYDNGVWICEKLDMLIDKLKVEKSVLEAKER